MSTSYFNDSLTKLEIDDELIKKLSNHQINSIKDLWCLSRKDLKEIGFSLEDINQIIIKLQLIGIDLNHKKYNKD